MAEWTHTCIEFDPTTDERAKFLVGLPREYGEEGLILNVQWSSRALTDDEIVVWAKGE